MFSFPALIQNSKKKKNGKNNNNKSKEKYEQMANWAVAAPRSLYLANTQLLLFAHEWSGLSLNLGFPDESR